MSNSRDAPADNWQSGVRLRFATMLNNGALTARRLASSPGACRPCHQTERKDPSPAPRNNCLHCFRERNPYRSAPRTQSEEVWSFALGDLIERPMEPQGLGFGFCIGFQDRFRFPTAGELPTARAPANPCSCNNSRAPDIRSSANGPANTTKNRSLTVLPRKYLDGQAEIFNLFCCGLGTMLPLVTPYPDVTGTGSVKRRRGR